MICAVSCNKKKKISTNEFLVLNDTSITKKNTYILDNLYKKLIQNNNDSINRNLLFAVANKYYDINKPDKYFEIASQITKLATLQKDSVHIAKSLNYIGYYYNNSTKLDSAFKYYFKAEKIYKALHNKIDYGNSKMYLAGIYYDSGNFVESEIEAIEALKQLRETNNNIFIFQCDILLALSLKEMSNYSKSLEYFELALKQLEKTEAKNSYSFASLLNNMGRVYEKQGSYKLAIQLYKKGLKIKDLRITNPSVFATLLNNLAYAKMKFGDTKGIKKLLDESSRIRDGLQIVPGIISSKMTIGEYHLYKNDTLKAVVSISEAYLLAKKIKSSPEVISTLKFLTKNSAKNKKHYADEYFRVSDSLQLAERSTRNKFARIAYETDQVEETNVVLSKRNTYIIIGSSIFFILLMALFSIYRLKSKNKELLFTQEQQKANEKIYQLMLKQQSEREAARKEERDRIAMELHDGIVNSIFTTRFNLMQLEPNQEGQKALLVKELENAEKEIRRVSHDLTQNLLFDDKNLPEIISNLVESQKNQFHTKFDLTIDKYIDWSRVSSENKIHIYRIIQESLQNANKYSKAEKCYIMLLKTEDKITIRIWDNGIGFNVEKVKQGIGLKNINERVKALNGKLKMSSKIGEGTSLEVVF